MADDSVATSPAWQDEVESSMLVLDGGWQASIRKGHYGYMVSVGGPFPDTAAGGVTASHAGIPSLPAAKAWAEDMAKRLRSVFPLPPTP